MRTIIEDVHIAKTVGVWYSKRRNLPLDLIVIDYFHWEKQGDWKFDPVYWPDPDAMIQELKEMGVELMVSV